MEALQTKLPTETETGTNSQTQAQAQAQLVLEMKSLQTKLSTEMKYLSKIVQGYSNPQHVLIIYIESKDKLQRRNVYNIFKTIRHIWFNKEIEYKTKEVKVTDDTSYCKLEFNNDKLYEYLQTVDFKILKHNIYFSECIKGPASDDSASDEVKDVYMVALKERAFHEDTLYIHQKIISLKCTVKKRI